MWTFFLLTFSFLFHMDLSLYSPFLSYSQYGPSFVDFFFLIPHVDLFLCCPFVFYYLCGPYLSYFLCRPLSLLTFSFLFPIWTFFFGHLYCKTFPLSFLIVLSLSFSSFSPFLYLYFSHSFFTSLLFSLYNSFALTPAIPAFLSPYHLFRKLFYLLFFFICCSEYLPLTLFSYVVQYLFLKLFSRMLSSISSFNSFLVCCPVSLPLTLFSYVVQYLFL
jgi:hypothetical protein